MLFIALDKLMHLYVRHELLHEISAFILVVISMMSFIYNSTLNLSLTFRLPVYKPIHPNNHVLDLLPKSTYAIMYVTLVYIEGENWIELTHFLSLWLIQK